MRRPCRSRRTARGSLRADRFVHGASRRGALPLMRWAPWAHAHCSWRIGRWIGGEALGWRRDGWESPAGKVRNADLRLQRARRVKSAGPRDRSAAGATCCGETPPYAADHPPAVLEQACRGTAPAPASARSRRPARRSPCGPAGSRARRPPSWPPTASGSRPRMVVSGGHEDRAQPVARRDLDRLGRDRRPCSRSWWMW